MPFICFNKATDPNAPDDLRIIDPLPEGFEYAFSIATRHFT